MTAGLRLSSATGMQQLKLKSESKISKGQDRLGPAPHRAVPRSLSVGSSQDSLDGTPRSDGPIRDDEKGQIDF